VEAESGSIEVDGLNTREMGTEDLRSRFSIIPQVDKGEKESGTGGTKKEGKFSGERPRSFETLQPTPRKSWRRIGRQIREVDLSLLLF
jgi:hypothetical protein